MNNKNGKIYITQFMAKLIIRKFKHGDEAELKELLLNTITRVNVIDYSPEEIQAWTGKVTNELIWQKHIAAINPFVALIQNTIVGYADLQDDGYITSTRFNEYVSNGLFSRGLR
ncbi:hypothetical protein [Catenovulum adriaticum]|uniref:Acetyltransferase (GNAT) family protein n=1 Tax=Catenovulum adriaticum TaxID=2984846 RepID=A0ABY7AT13_9ALTE|nr:hypothetical protein [Catenovulum sp. TS8]WAJ72398.1 hypothetical protein OLW01_16815 [Catenovulum sp. TS8]